MPFRIPVVLALHSVSSHESQSSISKDAFQRMLAELSGRVRFISLEEYTEKVGSLGASLVAITFDDGYKDIETVRVIAHENGDIPIAIFICMGLINQGSFGGKEILSEEELIELSKAQNFTIGCHSYDHKSAFQCSEGEYTGSVEENTGKLRKLGVTPSFHAYPKGHVKHADIVMSTFGFRALLTTQSPRFRDFFNPELIPRITINSETDFRDLRFLNCLGFLLYRTFEIKLKKLLGRDLRGI